MSGPTESFGGSTVTGRLPRIRTGLDREREPLVLAAGLLAGLVLFVPAFGAVVSALELPVPFPLLVGAVFVLGCYAFAVVLTRRVLAGTIVALVVLATFKANVPVLPAANQFPKDVVGDLLLVHLPLVVAAGLVVNRRWYRDVGLSGYLLGGFVLATTVPWLTGTAPSSLAAASFTLFVALGLLTFVAVAGAVADDVLAFRTVVWTFLLVVGTHAAVGVAQLLNQDPFGLARLGEGGPMRRVAVELPLVGEATMGPYVSGFTGMSFVLAYLVVLTLPAAIVLASRRDGLARMALAGWVVVLVGIVRASASDAARGALLVGLVTVAGLLAYYFRDDFRSTVRDTAVGRGGARLRAGVASVVVTISAIIFVYPSSASGAAVGSGNNGDASGGGGSSMEAGAGNAAEQIGRLSEFSIPFVSLANLDVRFLQYIAAVDVFRRHPLFGIGGMNWVEVAGKYGFEAPWNANFPVPIHSVYFTLLAETGAVGTLLYGGAILAVLSVGLSLARRDRSDSALVLAVLAGLVGALAYSAFGVLHLYAAAGLLPFWGMAGALVGESARFTA